MSPKVSPILETLILNRWYNIIYTDPVTNKTTQGLRYSIECSACGMDFVNTDKYKRMSDIYSGEHQIIPGFAVIDVILHDRNDIDFYEMTKHG